MLKYTDSLYIVSYIAIQKISNHLPKVAVWISTNHQFIDNYSRDIRARFNQKYGRLRGDHDISDV